MKGAHVHRDACSGGGNRGVRDAQRRLAAILRAARKLSVTSDDLVRLPAARRLTTDAGGGGGGGVAATSPEEQHHHEGAAGGRHVLLLPLVASAVALLAALLLFLCAGDGPPLARLRNASDPVPTTAAGLAKQRVLRAAASGPPRVYDRRDPSGGYRSNAAYGANAYSGVGGGGERNHNSASGNNGRITTARSGGGQSMVEREGNHHRPDDGDESADSLFDAPIRLMRR